MYSPKIREDLIPKLYEAAKKEDKPMTVLVSGILENWLKKEEVRT